MLFNCYLFCIKCVSVLSLGLVFKKKYKLSENTKKKQNEQQQTIQKKSLISNEKIESIIVVINLLLFYRTGIFS